MNHTKLKGVAESGTACQKHPHSPTHCSLAGGAERSAGRVQQISPVAHRKHRSQQLFVFCLWRRLTWSFQDSIYLAAELLPFSLRS